MNTESLLKKDGFAGEWMYVLPTESFIDLLKDEKVQRLYLTDVGYFPKARHHYRERPEGIPENIYIYCMDGEGEIELANGAKISLERNESFCIPAGVGHRYYAREENPWSILWMHFKGTDCHFYPINDCCKVHLGSQNAVSQMFSHFEMLYQALKNDYSLANFMYITDVISLILSSTYLLQQKKQTDQSSDLVTAAIRYMYENIDKNFSLQELADHFCISPSYLSRQFKNTTGHGPIDFFNQIKIDEACKLLRSTDLYIYQICQKLGFTDQYYFSRLFKKKTGLSPRAYK